MHESRLGLDGVLVTWSGQGRSLLHCHALVLLVLTHLRARMCCVVVVVVVVVVVLVVGHIVRRHTPPLSLPHHILHAQPLVHHTTLQYLPPFSLLSLVSRHTHTHTHTHTHQDHRFFSLPGAGTAASLMAFWPCRTQCHRCGATCTMPPPRSSASVCMTCV